ncbi:hypothetical protein FRC06_003594 [Ceratobasidium sp. 370]|nr:hypothetical protein FRC06_003594 [Ceratobasidium sp. 370]
MRWLSPSLILGSLHLASATLQIVPGGTWIASGTNKHIQAHGGGITKVGDTFYWIGEDKTAGWPFYGINCYSSKNLVEWTFVRALFTLQTEGDFGPNRIVERPKVIYNSATKQYVMWMHIDDYPEYAEAKVGVATSSSVCGNYTYHGSFRPGNLPSRDMTVFQDTDEKAYLITEQREVCMTAMYQLTDNYLSVGPLVNYWTQGNKRESPAMVKSNGVYFLFGSHPDYWNPNDNEYSTSKSISGPWSPWKKFAPEGQRTFRSQATFVLPLGNDKFMYMGDRWDGQVPAWKPQYLLRSTYIWLPLEISGTTASMNKWYDSWVPNIDSGSMAPVSREKWYEAESAKISGSAKTVGCGGCSGHSAVGWIGGSGGGTVTFDNIMSDSDVRTTLRIQTTNGDRVLDDTTVTVGGTKQVISVLRVRSMTVAINGVVQVLSVPPSDSGVQPAPLALNVDLKRGNNTITISGSGGEYAPDIDAIVAVCHPELKILNMMVKPPIRLAGKRIALSNLANQQSNHTRELLPCQVALQPLIPA